MQQTAFFRFYIVVKGFPSYITFTGRIHAHLCSQGSFKYYSKKLRITNYVILVQTILNYRSYA